ncbi:ABC transporter substrate-binding protein [Cellulomonas sp. NPDC089187]|uniref:ABC transporter substrate-binding protein n=1 Tax=Cellulomonas sp. NPDC089187 TaxID=3154970 RepID=UPI003433E3D9
MRSYRKTPVLALGAVLVATTAACSAPADSGSSSTSGSGSSSGTLNIACSQQEDFCQKITAAFEEATGIDATYVRLGAGEVLARLETTPGEFDVWSGGQAENHLIADERGFIERYVSPSAADLPAEYNDADGIWSGFYTDSVGFCSNQSELDKLGMDAPTSWEDLLAPELKGKVAMPHPATAGVGYMAIYTQQTLNDGDTDAAIDYFTQLHGNVMQYSKSAATGTEQAGRGEVAVAIALDSDCVKAAENGYSELVTSYPEEGTGYEVGAVSVLKDARNLDGAQQYMDWILTTEAQDLYKDVPSYAAPTLADAVAGDAVPDQDAVNKVEWDLKGAADNRDQLIELFESDVASSSSAQ